MKKPAKNKKRTTLELRRSKVRRLSEAQLGMAIGGQPPSGGSNAACYVGLCTDCTKTGS